LFDFVNSFPLGLDTYLLSGGDYLPPDVSAKILLARALVNNPSVMLLDTSWQLVYEMDKHTFDDLLSENNMNRSVIACVTDRALLDLFDQIIVLEEGKLVAFGSRKEVLNTVNIERFCHV
jgi:ATP-binding cassette subfamily B protein